MKLTVNVVESYTTYRTRESVEIDTDNYPELLGKTEEEVKEYLSDNLWDMDSLGSLYSTLGEELSEQDIVNDEMSNIDTEVEFGN
jgi:hypothetical protein